MLGYVPDMPHATARKRAAVAFLAETAPDQGASVSEGSLTLRRQLVLVVLAARFDLALAPSSEAQNLSISALQAAKATERLPPWFETALRASSP